MPEGAGSRRPLAPGDSGAPRFSRTPRRGRALVPGGARRFAARFPARPGRWSAAVHTSPPGRAAAAAPLVSHREETPSPGTGFSAPAATVRVCGHRGVIEKEAGKAEADCTSYAEKHGQTHPIYHRQRIETGKIADCEFI